MVTGLNISMDKKLHPLRGGGERDFQALFVSDVNTYPCYLAAKCILFDQTILHSISLKMVAIENW